MLRTAILCLALVVPACAGSPDDLPEIAIDRSACSHCGMLISEPRFAAAYRTSGGETKVFDEIGCLLAAADRHTDARTQFWFRDVNDGRWIDGGSPVFLASSSIRTPMAGNIVAYRDEAAAGRAAAAHGGRVVRSLTDLMALKGDRP